MFFHEFVRTTQNIPQNIFRNYESFVISKHVQNHHAQLETNTWKSRKKLLAQSNQYIRGLFKAHSQTACPDSALEHVEPTRWLPRAGLLLPEAATFPNHVKSVSPHVKSTFRPV